MQYILALISSDSDVIRIVNNGLKSFQSYEISSNSLWLIYEDNTSTTEIIDKIFKGAKTLNGYVICCEATNVK